MEMYGLLLLSLILPNCLAKECFQFKDKVALITGGTRGIGYVTARELLNNGVKGVTLVGTNAAIGKTVSKELNVEFGYGKVVFVQADVSEQEEFEDAFKLSVHHWKDLDIVINSAGITDENNWKRVIDVNAVGTLQGTFLGMKYMGKNGGGKGGVIINLSSILGIDPLFWTPVYDSTKSAIITFGRALGYPVYYNYNRVRVITLCPSATATEMIEHFAKLTSSALRPNMTQLVTEELAKYSTQTTIKVVKGLMSVLQEGSSGSIWVVEDDQPPYQVDFPDRRAIQKLHEAH